MCVDQQVGYTRAYVLINTNHGMVDSVVKSLRSRKDVCLADAINGPYEVIAVIEGNNASAVATAILFSIKKMPGIKEIAVYVAIPNSSFINPTRGGNHISVI